MLLIAAFWARKQVDDASFGLFRLLQRRFAAFTDGLGIGRRLERLSTVLTLLKIHFHNHTFVWPNVLGDNAASHLRRELRCLNSMEARLALFRRCEVDPGFRTSN